MENQDRAWTDWPVCSRCGRRRQAVCPACGAAGNQFLKAEYQAAGEPRRGTRELNAGNRGATEGGQQVLLLCSRCDEVFVPRFYRVCPACGADAGDGVEIERHGGEQISNRLLLAVGGLFVAVAFVLLYFWFLFR